MAKRRPTPDLDAIDRQMARTVVDGGPLGTMSVRDYFAAQALAGMLASPPPKLMNRSPESVNHAGWATNAYRFADAMIAARVGTGGSRD